jgi:hypothetical protein
MQVQHEHRPRTGDEPMHARSPLRARLVLACIGLANGLLGIGIFGFWLRTVPFLVVFAAIAAIAAVNVVVVLKRIRQGAHFQPGRDVPPYHPVDPEPVVPRVRRKITARRRTVRYLVIMGVCVTLILTAWFWVRYYSVLAAGIMSVVAMMLPPLAAVVTNADSPILRDGGGPDGRTAEREGGDGREGRGDGGDGPSPD